MPRKRKMKGGAPPAGFKPSARAVSNMMNSPAVPTPMSTWQRIKNFAKQHKILSRGLSAVGSMVGEKYAPIFNAGSTLASSYGYGKRKRKQKGGMVWNPELHPKKYKPPVFGNDPSKIMPFSYGHLNALPSMKGSGKVVRF